MRAQTGQGEVFWVVEFWFQSVAYVEGMSFYIVFSLRLAFIDGSFGVLGRQLVFSLEIDLSFSARRLAVMDFPSFGNRCLLLLLHSTFL